MNVRRYNAWRFHYPYVKGSADEPDELFELRDPSTGIGISPTGGIDMVDEQASVRQSILLLLSTIPGERVMRPDYGCELHRLVFSPNDNTTSGLAIHYVRQALDRWEPRAQITHLDAAPNPEYPERLEIALEYRLRRTQHTGELAFSIDLAGDQF
jgi:phage baseplate assembly protein W